MDGSDSSWDSPVGAAEPVGDGSWDSPAPVSEPVSAAVLSSAVPLLSASPRVSPLSVAAAVSLASCFSSSCRFRGRRHHHRLRRGRQGLVSAGLTAPQHASRHQRRGRGHSCHHICSHALSLLFHLQTIPYDSKKCALGAHSRRSAAAPAAIFLCAECGCVSSYLPLRGVRLRQQLSSSARSAPPAGSCFCLSPAPLRRPKFHDKPVFPV